MALQGLPPLALAVPPKPPAIQAQPASAARMEPELEFAVGAWRVRPVQLRCPAFDTFLIPAA